MLDRKAPQGSGATDVADVDEAQVCGKTSADIRTDRLREVPRREVRVREKEDTDLPG